jgi:hypothetical protein
MKIVGWFWGAMEFVHYGYRCSKYVAAWAVDGWMLLSTGTHIWGVSKDQIRQEVNQMIGELIHDEKLFTL